MGYLQKSTIPKPVVRNSQTNEKGKHGWHLHTLPLLTEGKKIKWSLSCKKGMELQLIHKGEK